MRKEVGRRRPATKRVVERSIEPALPLIGQEALAEIRAGVEVLEPELAGGGQEFAGQPAEGGGVVAAEQVVAGPGEVDGVDEVEIEQAAGQFAATFAVEVVDSVVAAQGGEEVGQAAAVEKRFAGKIGGRVGVGIGDQQVDPAARGLEQRVVGGKRSAA